MRICVPSFLPVGFLAVGLGACCIAAPAPLPTTPKEHATLVGHKGRKSGVRALAFSPDGKMLLSAGYHDLNMRLWDVASARTTILLRGHGEGMPPARLPIITAVAFSPDGRMVASGDDERIVRLWDIATGKTSAILKGDGPLVALRFSPDGKSLFAVGGLVARWELRTKERKTYSNKKLPIGFGSVLTHTPAGKLLIANLLNYPQSSSFVLWAPESGAKPILCEGHTDAVSCLAFSRDGKLVASASHDHTIRLWDTTTGKNISTFKDRPGRVGRGCLAFSADGKLLACGYKHQKDDGKNDAHPAKGSIRIYETTTGRVLATLRGDPGPISPVAFSPDGRLLATGTFFKPTITLWSLPRRWPAAK